MSSDLKTLKDIETTVYDMFNRETHTSYSYSEDLQDAARQWIKQLEKEKKHWEKDTPTCGFDSDPIFSRFIDSNKYYAIVEKINWIKFFFNLEEE